MKYDFLIVGSGLYGATFAYFAKKAGKKSWWLTGCGALVFYMAGNMLKTYKPTYAILAIGGYLAGLHFHEFSLHGKQPIRVLPSWRNRGSCRNNLDSPFLWQNWKKSSWRIPRVDGKKFDGSPLYAFRHDFGWSKHSSWCQWCFHMESGWFHVHHTIDTCLHKVFYYKTHIHDKVIIAEWTIWAVILPIFSTTRQTKSELLRI